jgi:hypothetical protein
VDVEVSKFLMFYPNSVKHKCLEIIGLKWSSNSFFSSFNKMLIFLFVNKEIKNVNYPVGYLSTLLLKLGSSNCVHKTQIQYHIEALCYKPKPVTEFIKLGSALSSMAPFWHQNQPMSFTFKVAPPLLYLDRVFSKTGSSNPDLG